MRIRTSIFAQVVALVVLAMGLSLWQFIRLENEAEGQRAQDQADREAASVRALVGVVNTNLRDRLFDQIGREETGRHLGLTAALEETLDRSLNESPFLATALFKFDGKDKWQPAWLHQRKTLNGRWPEGFLRGLLQELPMEGVKDEGVRWHHVTDSSKQTIFVIMGSLKLSGDSVVAVGILPVTAMQVVSDTFAGTDEEVLVVDNHGFALAYGEQAYVGSNLNEVHPAVTEVLRRREVSGAFSSSTRRQVSARFAAHRVADANLYTLVGSPQNSGWAFVPRLLVALVIFGAALILAGFGFANWLATPLEKAIAYFQAQLDNVAHGRAVAFYPEGNPYLQPLKGVVERLIAKTTGETPTYIREATSEQVETEKMGAYKEISVGLAQALKEPLSSVLAQAQLGRAKASGEEFKENFVVIEREARHARDTLENLLRLTGEEHFPRQRLDLQDVILATLATQKGLISSHNVRVQKELVETAAIQAHSGQLQTALEEIIKNAVEAMDQTSDRVLKVSTSVTDTSAQIKIEDNGAGLPEGNVSKAFDPFFTTKSDDEHKGLGLTVAKGIVKSIGGSLRIESPGEGKGATVTVEFPLLSPRKAEESPEPGSLSRPLTGTQSDELPTPPAPDEVTLTGIHASDESSDLLIRPPKVKEPS